MRQDPGGSRARAKAHAFIHEQSTITDVVRKDDTGEN
jgi:hypothetical protein